MINRRFISRYPLLHKHKCSIQCRYIFHATDNEDYRMIENPLFRNGMCNLSEQCIPMPVHLYTFSIRSDVSIEHLHNIIVPEAQFNLHIDFPIRKTQIIPIQKKTKGFSLYEILYIIRQVYANIYKTEYETKYIEELEERLKEENLIKKQLLIK